VDEEVEKESASVHWFNGMNASVDAVFAAVFFFFAP